MTQNFENVFPKFYDYGLPVFRENSIYAASIVNNMFSPEPRGKGNSIDFELPLASVTTADVGSNALDVKPNNLHDLNPTTRQLVLDQWKQSGYQLDGKEITALPEGTISTASVRQMQALAVEADLFIQSKGITAPVYIDRTNSSGELQVLGSDGTVKDITNVMKTADKMRMPRIGRKFTLDPDSNASLFDVRAFSDASWQSNNNMDTMAGYAGDRFGFSYFMTNNVYKHETAVHGIATSYSVAAAQRTAGATTIQVTGGVDNALVKPGDVFTIGTNTTPYVVQSVTNNQAGTRTATITIGTDAEMQVATGISAEDAALSGAQNLVFKPSRKVVYAMVPEGIYYASRLTANPNPENGKGWMSNMDPVSKQTITVTYTALNLGGAINYSMLYGARQVRTDGIIQIGLPE